MPVEGQGLGRASPIPGVGAAVGRRCSPHTGLKNSGVTLCWARFKNCFLYKLMVTEVGEAPGTSREASGVPCLNQRRGLTLLSQSIKQAKPPPPHPILLSFTATIFFFFLNKLKVYSDPA